MSGMPLEPAAAEVGVQRRVPARGVPSPASLRAFAHAAGCRSALTLRIVDEAESQALNHRYRERDYATNVLSFPGAATTALPPALRAVLPLGDLVLCAPVIAREAAQQNKPPRAHWAHMIVHGVLHLRGFDHVDDGDAAVMEAEERHILAGLGIPDPY